MKKSFGIVAAAALAVGGMAMVGCHSNNPDNNPSASIGGVGGGGSTDSYGTGADARMRSTGNIGMNSGNAASNNGVTAQPAVTAGERTPNNQPPQTPTSPGGGTGAAGTGNSSNGNGSFQGSTTGNESGAGARTNTVPSGSTTNTNSGNNNSGAVVGGTSGNGSTGTGQRAPGPNEGR